MLQQELDIALAAAKEAADFQMQNLYSHKDIEIKPDQSPVSHIDRESERMIITHLKAAFPHDSFLGEESGKTRGTSGRTWIIDPLDATRAYLKQMPIFSVLIALIEDKTPVVGVMHLPAMQEVYYAAKNRGAYCNEKTIQVSKTNSLNQAYGSAYGHIPRLNTKEAQAVLQQMHQWRFASGFMDAYTYGCIASGRLDLCLNLSDQPWDCAAAACIITEAGGQYSDIHGNQSIFNGSFVISNGLLHEAALQNLNLTEPLST